MQEGDHVCCLYDYLHNGVEAATAFLFPGIRNQEKLLLVAERELASAVLNELEKKVDDAGFFILKDQIKQSSPAEIYLADQIFDPDRIFSIFQEELLQAQMKGYKTLRICGDLSWIKNHPQYEEAVLSYEQKATSILKQKPILALCMYDASALTPDFVNRVIEKHPYIAIGKKILKNCFHIPEIEQLTLNKAEKELALKLHTFRSLCANDNIDSGRVSFESLCESTSDCMTIWDRDLNCLFANSATIAYLNLEPDNPGKDIYEHLRNMPELLSKAVDRVTHVFATGKEFIAEDIIHTPERTISNEVKLTPVLDQSGNVVAVGVVYRDISSRIAAEKLTKEQKNFYQTLLEIIPAPLFHKDRQGRYTGFNQAFVDFFGLNREEMIGKSVFDIAPPDLASRYHEKDLAVMRQHGIQIYESRLVDAKGEEHDVIFRKASIPGEEGECQGVMGILLDVTENRRNERELQEKEKQLRLILDAASDGFWDWEIPGDEIKWSNRCFEILGYEADEFTIDSDVLKNLIHHDDYAGVEKAVRNALVPGSRGLHVEFRHLGKHGDYKWIRSTGKLVEWSKDNTPLRMVGTYKDIDEFKAMELRLLHIEKLSVIGQLAGGVAHDFNNQLTGIIGYAQLLQSRIENQKLNEYANNILKAAKHSSDLVAKLLTFARKGNYRSELIHLHDMIRETVFILTQSVDRRIKIQEEMHAQTPLVEGDPSMLHNMLLNLALNARDAISGKGEIVIASSNVQIDTDYCFTHGEEVTPGYYVKISVTDNGCGMTSEELSHCFEPFYTTKEQGKGTGMGLASVYGTVKMHGGFINTYSEKGHGSTFNVYLPVALAKDASTPPQSNIRYAERNAHIMYVDDEFCVRDTASEFIRDLGYRITAFESGKAALEYYRQHWREVDMAILDMIMPELNGRELFAELKEINPAILALLCSGYSLNGEAREMLNDGVQGFVQKPFDKHSLAKGISSVLERAHPKNSDERYERNVQP